MKADNVNNTIDSLRNFELTVALLYDTYSNVFPEDHNRWQSFVEEEKMHAKWLSGLKLYHQNQIVSFKETKITIQAINKTIEFIQIQIDRARQDEINRREAVMIALQLESSILENSFLKIFNFSTPMAKNVLMKLTRETRRHREKFILWLDTIENRAQLVA